MNDAAGNLSEGATFCKANDSFRPGLDNTIDGVGHQLCPDDLTMGVDELTDANPTNWYVRVMFDELLDPNVEDLVPILDDTGMDTGTVSGTLANTQPFTLQCQSVNGGALVDIPYDGYYSPAGNRISWPVGPSLVVVPSSPSLVATQSECQLTLKDNIKDKDGNPVPSDQRGPYKFKIAPVQVIAADTAPADGDMVDAVAAGVDLTFNTPIDPTNLAITWTPDPGDDYVSPESDTEFFLGADFEVNASYTWALTPGIMIADQCGKTTTIGTGSVDTGDAGSFTTNPISFNGIAPFDTQMNAKASTKIQLKFNEYMDPTTLASTEYTLTPAVQGVATSYDAGFNLIIDGEYKPDTDYTFTFKNGATIDDCPGAEFAFGGCVPKSAMGGTFTNTADQVVHFHTAPMALTGTSPADNATVTPSASGKIKIDLTFNTDVAPASLTTAEYSVSPAITFAAPTNPATGLGVPATSNNVIELVSTGAVTPGDYVFTLKMGATVNDLITGTPDTFTQAADKVIHFTVPAPSPAGPACF